MPNRRESRHPSPSFSRALDSLHSVTALLREQSASRSPRFTLPKFSGETSSTAASDWLELYTEFCIATGWDTDALRLKHVLHFFEGMAATWFLLDGKRYRESNDWHGFRIAFLDVFAGNVVTRWDVALAYRYRGGQNLMEYLYLKRSYLNAADSGLSSASTIGLIIQGLPRFLQRQVLLMAPTSADQLTEIFRNLQSPPTDSDPSCPPFRPAIPVPPEVVRLSLDAVCLFLRPRRIALRSLASLRQPIPAWTSPTLFLMNIPMTRISRLITIFALIVSRSPQAEF